MAEKPWLSRRRLPAIAAGVFMLIFTVGVISLVVNYLSHAQPPEKVRTQQISLVKPPPPKPEEKPPEPERQEQQQPREEVRMEAPPTPDQPKSEGPPPGEQLGLDADGGAGGDAFGLAARKGGRDITTLGGQGGGDRDAWYSWMIKRQLESQLRVVKRLQGASYSVVLDVWFDDGGAVEKVRMHRGTGDPDLDGAIRAELKGCPPLQKPLPPEIPQPVRIQVSSRA